MDKQTTYNELHSKLSEKYKISWSMIGTIRSQALGHGMSREDIMDWVDAKIKEAKKAGHPPKEQWPKLFDFLETLEDAAFEEIIQRTKFDVKKP